MKYRILALALFTLGYASAAIAAPPVVSVTHANGRNRIVVEYDAVDLATQPPPLLPVPEWSGLPDPVLFMLTVPDSLDTADHGSVSLLDPTSGAVRVVAAGMFRRAVYEGSAPPTMQAGMRAKIREKLASEYDAAVTAWMFTARAESTPEAVASWLYADAEARAGGQ